MRHCLFCGKDFDSLRIIENDIVFTHGTGHEKVEHVTGASSAELAEARNWKPAPVVGTILPTKVIGTATVMPEPATEDDGLRPVTERITKYQVFRLPQSADCGEPLSVLLRTGGFANSVEAVIGTKNDLETLMDNPGAGDNGDIEHFTMTLSQQSVLALGTFFHKIAARMEKE